MIVWLVMVVLGLGVQGAPCDFFKQYVGKVPVCTPTQEDYLLETDPTATPYGGMDVSNSGCNYIYYNKCCGIYPRWNWILGGCEPGMSPSSPGFACTADVQKNSAYDIYYISAYQWDGNRWVLDPTSSVSGNGGLINGLPSFANLKIDGTDSPYPPGGDWQAKWTPRTATTQTKGLGPPGFMFVLSARKVQWMTFYALPQKTVNRGPEGQFIPSGYDNCWYAELDFLEAPFWGPSKSCLLSSRPNAAFFSSGAQYGGCFPMGTNIGENFANECYTQWCCEATRCGADFKPFIDPSAYGTTVAGCAGSSTPAPPPGQSWCGLQGAPQKCDNFRALGGCGSSSFFDNDPSTEYIFAFVVDKTGIFGYRWISDTEGQANAFWPGIYKYNSSSVLTANRPSSRPQVTTTPCGPSDPSCVIFHPTSTGDRPCVTAAGDVNYLGHMGVAAAGGSNWWNLFDDTRQWWNYDSSITPTTWNN